MSLDKLHNFVPIAQWVYNVPGKFHNIITHNGLTKFPRKLHNIIRSMGLQNFPGKLHNIILSMGLQCPWKISEHHNPQWVYNVPGEFHNIITHNGFAMSLENFITLYPLWICICGKNIFHTLQTGSRLWKNLTFSHLTNGFVSLEKSHISYLTNGFIKSQPKDW
jgi:hypothetical protein